MFTPVILVMVIKFNNFLDPKIRLNNIKFDRKDFAYIIVGVDILSMLVLFFSLLIISRSQTITSDFFYLKYTKISNFTLHFTNLNLNINNMDYEINRFSDHLFKVFYFEKESVNNLYDKFSLK
jgi:hypothetical protein